MSQENVEVVSALFDAWRRGGVDAAAELYDPEVVFTMRGDVGGREAFHGIQGLRDALESFGGAWEQIEFEPLELLDAGAAVAVLLRFHLRSRSGVPLEIDEGWVYWLRAGKIHRIEQYGTREQALEAAGLSK